MKKTKKFLINVILLCKGEVRDPMVVTPFPSAKKISP